MATITAQYVVNRVLKTLHDDTTTPVRWTKADLLEALNDGQREIVKLVPPANAVTASLQLVSGTRQTIPAAGISLIDVTRNMGTGGATPGKVIRQIQRAVLDDENPNWHTDAANAVASYWMFDPRNPKNFFVYPQQPTSSPNQVEIVFSSSPSSVVVTDWTGSTVISIDDVYANDLINWILYQAYSKDAEHAANSERADKYYAAFTNGLGLKQKGDASVSPSVYGQKSTGK